MRTTTARLLVTLPYYAAGRGVSVDSLWRLVRERGIEPVESRNGQDWFDERALFELLKGAGLLSVKLKTAPTC